MEAVAAIPPFERFYEERKDEILGYLGRLLGREAAEAMVEVGGERGDLRIAGFACSPAGRLATTALSPFTQSASEPPSVQTGQSPPNITRSGPKTSNV